MKKNLPVTFAADVIKFVPSGEPAKIENIAYSGNIVDELDDAGNPVKIIVDLDSIQLKDNTQERYPMVFSHGDTDWIGSFTLAHHDGKLVMNDIEMLENPNANMVVDALKKRFPVKASIHVVPNSIEYVSPDENQVINGRSVSDVFVFKDAVIREVSATAFPRDKATSLSLFSEEIGKKQFITYSEMKMSEEKTKDVKQDVDNGVSDLTAQLETLRAQLAQKEKMLEMTALKLSETEAENVKISSENQRLAEEAESIALELRMKEISDLESCLGEFSEEERGKLQGLDGDTFELVSGILKKWCESKMAQGETEMPADEMESEPEMMSQSQMSEKQPLHAALFADQAKSMKSQIGQRPDADFLKWIHETIK